VLLQRPLQVLAVVTVIVLGKSIAAAGLVLLLRYPLNTALTVSASLAQIGEFSFILAALGVSLRLLPPEGQSLILAGALISIALNPLLFALLEPARRAILARSASARRLEARDDPLAELPASTDSRYLARQVVLVGHGRVGRQIAQALAAQGIACVVADSNRERVEALRAQGLAAVCGDATEPETLVQAHIAQAQWLVIAIPDLVGVRAMVETARMLNPGVRVLVRCHNEDEAVLLAREPGVQVMLSERALAQAMVQQVLQPAPG
jgi:CPA2 family monovalent cation:H+ antiporter-2